MRRLDILGLPVDPGGADDAARWLRATLRSAGPGCRHLVTLNPEYVMMARHDPAFRAALRAADLVTADGVGIVLAARWLWPDALGEARLERITGVDLVERIAQLDGGRAFLLGGAPGVAATAAERLTHRWPGFVPAGFWDGGSADPAADRESLDRIARSGARVVLVAYGAPGQVLWIARNQDALGRAGVRLVIGVGGTFDFLAGAVPRAPGWMRRIGLEWLYRLVREPWRWRRQRVLPLFAIRVLFTGIAHRLPRRV